MGIVDYRTGIVNNVGDLLSVVQAACTDNGWTLTAGNVLHKTDATTGNTCFVRVDTQTTNLRITGGTGVDGAGLLTGSLVISSVERSIRIGAGVGLLPAPSFPWVYHVHVYDQPDCVFVVINYNGDFYQHAEWGCSDLILPGNGTWFAGMVSNAGSHSGGGISITARGGGQSGSPSAWPFGHSNAVNYQCGFIHHGFDGGGWSGAGTQNDSVWADGEATIIRPIGRLLAVQPNDFNSRPVPQPAVVRVRRSDANVSVAATIPALRLLRIDTLAPGEVFSYGLDHWKAYPIYRRDSLNRNGGNFIQHSGTMGFCLAVDPS